MKVGDTFRIVKGGFIGTIVRVSMISSDGQYAWVQCQGKDGQWHDFSSDTVEMIRSLSEPINI